MEFSFWRIAEGAGVFYLFPRRGPAPSHFIPFGEQAGTGGDWLRVDLIKQCKTTQFIGWMNFAIFLSSIIYNILI